MEYDKLDSDGNCRCPLCERGRRFYRNTANLSKIERDWMLEVYNKFVGVEEELEMIELEMMSENDE